MWQQVKNHLISLNITALPASGYAVIPFKLEDKVTGDIKQQCDDIQVLCAELQPLLPPGYRAEIPETSRKYPDECILIGIASSLTDYAFDNIK